ncbi:hypothetical protein WJX72_008551 [[Myrmecia] bisecta]|uniref:Protein kinase domain-containing protein n=1 Tax=[Myrmecia] bisecta TaxID=41462 RepID=A0AAW1QRX5_9CHLO
MVELGAGCGGAVYEGVWKGARVAVKLIWHQRHGFDSNKFASQEALFSKASVHPCVVATYRVYTVQHTQAGASKSPGGPAHPAAPYDMATYIVMERCEGSLEEKHAVLWESLQSSFTEGLSSVLRTLVEIVISDFGLSRFIKLGSKAHTDRPGAVLLAAPEKMLSGYMCTSGDVFSFGMIAWFLISKGDLGLSSAEHDYQESNYRWQLSQQTQMVVVIGTTDSGWCVDTA